MRFILFIIGLAFFLWVQYEVVRQNKDHFSHLM